MKKTGIFILVLAVLAISAYFLTQTNTGSTLEANERDFAVTDTAGISRIFMADKKGNSVSLSRAGNYWVVNDKVKARPDAVKLLLETINGLRVKAPVSKSAYDRVIRNLASNSTKVEIYMGDEKPAKVFYVGGPTQEHTGTYILLEGASKPFVMHIEGFFGFLTPRFFVNAKQWQNNGVFNYEYGDIAVLDVQYPMEQERGYQIKAVDSVKYALFTAKGDAVEGFNAGAVAGHLALFDDLNFEGFEETKSETFIDSVKSSVPYKVVTITDKAGDKREAKFFKKPMPPGSVDFDYNPLYFDADRMYILIDNERFVIGQYFVFDKIDAEFKQFLLPES